MADACESLITPTLVTAAGIEQTLVTGDSCGSRFPCVVNNVWIRATNTGAARNITFHAQHGGSDIVVAVPQTTGDVTFAFNDVSELIDGAGFVHLTYSGVPTAVSIKVFRMPAPG